jgi:hypothetical protein
MHEKRFTLSRTQSEDMWRRFKQTDDHRIAERLHAILLLDSGQNAETVSQILHIHPKTLKRWVKAFAAGGEDAVTQAAKALHMRLLYLPTYSPNLNLIERFWKFLKRKVARNHYYATFADFRTAVQQVLNNIAEYGDELASLMSERFQLFTTP